MQVWPLIIGFTGTRDGMTNDQYIEVKRLLAGFDPDLVRHGDCVGADEEFHQISQQLGLNITIHPPIEARLRAYCQGGTILKPKEYLVRDRDIVEMSDLLIAAPKSQLRKGGTWYTIGIADELKKECWVVWPDGIVTCY